jgi:hypothetical protein
LFIGHREVGSRNSELTTRDPDVTTQKSAFRNPSRDGEGGLNSLYPFESEDVSDAVGESQAEPLGAGFEICALKIFGGGVGPSL